jgi:hypothetical protein
MYFKYYSTPSAEVKNAWSYGSTYHTSAWRIAELPLPLLRVKWNALHHNCGQQRFYIWSVAVNMYKIKQLDIRMFRQPWSKKLVSLSVASFCDYGDEPLVSITAKFLHQRNKISTA